MEMQNKTQFPEKDFENLKNCDVKTSNLLKMVIA